MLDLNDKMYPISLCIRNMFYLIAFCKESVSLSAQKACNGIEFFRIEFYRIYTICRRIFLLISIFKITENSILQKL